MSLVVRTMLVVFAFGLVAAPASSAPPEISVSSTIPSGWLTGGTYTVSAVATGAGDLGNLSIAIATERRLKPELVHCALCDRLSVAAEIKPALMRDGVGEIVVVASDVDGVRSSTTLQVPVDHTAPPAAGAISLAGEQSWRAGNRFDVTWPELAPDSGSPVVAARYELCPVARAGDCVSSRRELDGTVGITGLSLPGSGIWRLQVA